jgi:hypothetical protein
VEDLLLGAGRRPGRRGNRGLLLAHGRPSLLLFGYLVLVCGLIGLAYYISLGS